MQRYLVLETVTGGVDPKTTSLLAVGMTVYENNRKLDELYLHTKPDDGVYKVKDSLKGLDITRKEFSYYEASDKVYTFLNDYSHYGEIKLVVIGNNTTLKSINFIQEHLVSDVVWNEFVSSEVFDLHVLTKFLQDANVLPKSLDSSLESVSKHFNINYVNDNSRVVMEVYQELLYQVRNLVK